MNKVNWSMQTLNERQTGAQAGNTALGALKSHWPEYLMEAALLATFMISACVFTVLLEHPGSALHQSIEDPFVRRSLMGLAMGATLIGIVYSPWGQRSGAHMNPFLTLAFFTLGKVDRWDALFYSLAHFAGGVAGVLIAVIFIGTPVWHGAVNYAVTIPGSAGAWAAFGAEVVISLVLIITVLTVSNTKRLSRFTGVFAGTLVAIYIAAESPYSGMSMNPARTLGSAFFANEWTAIWVYFTAPLIAMLAGAQLFRLRRGAQAVLCAKLHHHNGKRCIFRCNYGEIDGK
jgi:aquaporin Z